MTLIISVCILHGIISDSHNVASQRRFCFWPKEFLWQVFGTATKPLILWLLPVQFRSNTDDTSGPPSPKGSLDEFHVPLLQDEQDANGDSESARVSHVNQILNGLPRPQSIGMLLTAPTSTIHHVWRKFDDSYMRPMFGGRGFVRMISRRMSDVREEDEALEDPDYHTMGWTPLSWLSMFSSNEQVTSVIDPYTKSQCVAWKRSLLQSSRVLWRLESLYAVKLQHLLHEEKSTVYTRIEADRLDCHFYHWERKWPSGDL